MGTAIVFETHSLTDDDELGCATGWLPGRLSARGRALARELGVRRRHDGLSAVFTSDLRRAAETAAIAFNGSRAYRPGGLATARVRLRRPQRRASGGGPRPSSAMAGRCLSRRRELAASGRACHRVPGGPPVPLERAVRLLIGHVATRWALDQQLLGTALEDLVAADFGCREGWDYELS